MVLLLRILILPLSFRRMWLLVPDFEFMDKNFQTKGRFSSKYLMF